MAIDSAEKRKNVSGIGIPLLPEITPNATKDSEWRQQAGWGYSGIAVGAPPSVADSNNFIIWIRTVVKS